MLRGRTAQDQLVTEFVLILLIHVGREGEPHVHPGQFELCLLLNRLVLLLPPLQEVQALGVDVV